MEVRTPTDQGVHLAQADSNLSTLHFQVLLILFSVLRKVAWDYGRLALVSRTEAR